MIFFGRIMCDGRLHMWIRFIMEDEMTIVIVLPLVEGFSSSMIIALSLVQLLIVKQYYKKFK
jgi:hypothetical protein